MRKRIRSRGFFISFEKTAEGLGGTTQSLRLVEALNAAGIPAVWTREPGGTQVGKMIREILLSKEKHELSRATELLLYVADRAQNYRQIIKPALSEGKVVVSDRYMDSTMIYQGTGRGWNRGFLLRLHQAATGGLLPDITFILDGTSHRKQANDDRWESLPKEFHAKLADATRRLAGTGGRYILINASRSIDEVAEDIMQHVQLRMRVKEAGNDVPSVSHHRY